MAELTITALDAEGPIPPGLAGLIFLCDNAGEEISGQTEDGTVAVVLPFRFDRDGEAVLEVIPNADFDEVNTFWCVKFAHQTFIILKTDQPQTLRAALAVDPGPLGDLAASASALAAETQARIVGDADLQAEIDALPGGGGSGTVTSVAGVDPDITGDVPLTATDVGALSTDGGVVDGPTTIGDSSPTAVTTAVITAGAAAFSVEDVNDGSSASFAVGTNSADLLFTPVGDISRGVSADEDGTHLYGPQVDIDGVDVATVDDLAGFVDQAAIDQAITDLIGGAPGALDTLNELAAALGDDASFAASVATALGLKATAADLVTETNRAIAAEAGKQPLDSDLTDLADLPLPATTVANAEARRQIAHRAVTTKLAGQGTARVAVFGGSNVHGEGGGLTGSGGQFDTFRDAIDRWKGRRTSRGVVPAFSYSSLVTTTYVFRYGLGYITADSGALPAGYTLRPDVGPGWAVEVASGSGTTAHVENGVKTVKVVCAAKKTNGGDVRLWVDGVAQGAGVTSTTDGSISGTVSSGKIVITYTGITGTSFEVKVTGGQSAIVEEVRFYTDATLTGAVDVENFGHGGRDVEDFLLAGTYGGTTLAAGTFADVWTYLTNQPCDHYIGSFGLNHYFNGGTVVADFEAEVKAWIDRCLATNAYCGITLDLQWRGGNTALGKVPPSQASWLADWHGAIRNAAAYFETTTGRPCDLVSTYEVWGDLFDKSHLNADGILLASDDLHPNAYAYQMAGDRWASRVTGVPQRKPFLPSDGTGRMSGNLDMDGSRVTNVPDAQAALDALNRQFADGRYVTRTLSGATTGTIGKLYNLTFPGPGSGVGSGGIIFIADVDISAAFGHAAGTDWSPALGVGVAGDGYPRVAMFNGGMYFGPGNAALDANISRTSSSVLTLAAVLLRSTTNPAGNDDLTRKGYVDTMVPKTLVDAKGDLLTATADDTPARLAVGSTARSRLIVDSTAGTGLAWEVPPIFARKTSPTSRTSTSPSSDPDLTTGNLAISTLYRFQCYLSHQGLAADDISIQVTMPTGCTIEAMVQFPPTNVAAVPWATNARRLIAGGSAFSAGLVDASTPTATLITGLVVMSTNTGTFAVAWSATANTGTNVTLNAGSWMLLEKVA